MSSFCRRQSSSLLNERMSAFVVSVEELEFAQREDGLLEKVLWFFYLTWEAGENDVFFWISYCSYMLTVILKLSIQMRSVSRALANIDCVACRTSPPRQELLLGPLWDTGNNCKMSVLTVPH